jgi:beta-mannosidase
MQADGIALAALHHRASRPYTMGSLYWQLNDVWPGASWSSVDYFGRWKALHYQARRFFAPVAVAALRDEGTTRVRLLNDGDAGEARWRLRVMDVDGKVLRRREQAVTLAAAGVTAVGDFSDAELLAGADPKRTIAVFEVLQGRKTTARQVVGFVEAKDQVLPRQALRATLDIEGDHYRLRLQSSAFVRAAWVDFGALEVQLEDNLLDLLPGESRDISVRGPVDLATLREALEVRSLNDR